MQAETVRVDTNGDRFHYQDYKLHRTDGPACEYASGTKKWLVAGRRHRTDGPAIEYPDGAKFYYQDDLLHRIDGPACEHALGGFSWFLNGTHYPFDEFLELTPISPEEKFMLKLIYG